MKTIQPLFSTLRRPQVQEVLVEEPLLVGKHIFDRVNLTQGRWDQSRQFKIFDHVYNGEAFEQLSRDYNVTLVTQSSLHKLHWLTQVISILNFRAHFVIQSAGRKHVYQHAIGYKRMLFAGKREMEWSNIHFYIRIGYRIRTN